MQHPHPTRRAVVFTAQQDSDPIKVNDESEAVFYFPGYGSARLFSEVGLAILAMLYHSGVQTVLPPGYLCCGYQPLTQGCVPIIKGWARSR